MSKIYEVYECDNVKIYNKLAKLDIWPFSIRDDGKFGILWLYEINPTVKAIIAKENK